MKKNKENVKKPLNKLHLPTISLYVNNDYKDNKKQKNDKEELKSIDNIFTKDFINNYFD